MRYNQLLNLPFMITISLYKAPKAVLDKINKLLSTLRLSKKLYEQTAAKLKNSQFQGTILGLAQENRQFAEELAAHLHTMGGEESMPVPDTGVKTGAAQEKVEWEGGDDEKAALTHCAMREWYTGQQYEDVLKEPHLHENLRRLISYQLKGLMHSIAQMTLLNNSLAKS